MSRQFELHMSDRHVGHPALGWIDRPARRDDMDDDDACENEDHQFQAFLRKQGFKNAKVRDGKITLQETLTSSGNHRIFDATDPEFCPGKLLGPRWETGDGPWFFMPTDWNAGNHWGGFAITRITGIPMPYSQGHATLEAALAEAEKWESTKEAREAIFLRHAAQMKDVFLERDDT